MSSDWRIQAACRACGASAEFALSALDGRTTLPCPRAGCAGDVRLPPDLTDTARFLFEETRRRLAAAESGRDA
jgi:hypothetical protein